MKLYTVLFKGKERPAVEKDGALYEVNGFKDMNDLIEGFAPGSGDSLSLGAALSGYTLLSPIVKSILSGSCHCRAIGVADEEISF